MAAVPGALEISRREKSWLGLGEDVVAFAADNDDEWQRLEVEHWLIDRWRAAGVPVPRVLREDATLRVQVRERVHGLFGAEIHAEGQPSRLTVGPMPNERDRLDEAPLTAFGTRLAESYGEIAARIHSAISIADAVRVGLGPTRHRVLDLDAAIAELHACDASPTAKAAAVRSRGWLATTPPADAVIHGDLHFWNMCLASDGSVVGVFDFDGAGIDTAATELLYVHSLGAQFAARVIDAYGPIDLGDVHRACVRSALDQLLWHRPGSEHRDHIVAWASAVLERFAT